MYHPSSDLRFQDIPLELHRLNMDVVPISLAFHKIYDDYTFYPDQSVKPLNLPIPRLTLDVVPIVLTIKEIYY